MNKLFKTKNFLIVEGILLAFLIISFLLSKGYIGSRYFIECIIFPSCPSGLSCVMGGPVISCFKPIGTLLILVFGTLSIIYLVIFLIYHLIRLFKK